ncbi:MlaD family protein [Duncaniella freteri]|jgi:phospholipid/cholesterol/gamma-HCH transport system substrate-binding protein|uniref:MCE family protein n=4 Tax=Duncaniella TaxID=2518495 RepID=A0A4Z0VBM7_9BACT|nr:MlaD family protein [Duncaniella freteri]NBJ08860.1 MCE family protein [Alistipes sp. Z76]NCE70877.1 MCE family protein [Muribaculaceae bacterium M3]TGG40863.1 MCE family protein [Duncaniella freteri]
MNKLFSREIIIGASVLIALLALVFGINYLKGVNIFKAANYYYASYTNVAGLAQSAPVTLNGYKVGLVRDIAYEYDNPGHVKVEISLDRQLLLPEGTSAVIVTDMLGTSTIELRMGTSPNLLEVGSKISGVVGSGLMDKVSTELMPSIIQIAPHIDSLVVALTAVAADPALVNSVRRLDAIMANLEATTTQLNRTVPALLKNANSTMANVSDISANISQVSSALAVLSDDLKRMPLDSTLRNINSITANLDEATSKLNSTNSSLGLLLNDPGLYHNLNNSAAHVDSILIDLKKQPKRYIPSIKIF